MIEGGILSLDPELGVAKYPTLASVLALHQPDL
jgi:hypothetical protein